MLEMNSSSSRTPPSCVALPLLSFFSSSVFFFFTDTATTEISTLSLHDALPICGAPRGARRLRVPGRRSSRGAPRRPGGRRALAVLPGRLPRRSRSEPARRQPLAELAVGLHDVAREPVVHLTLDVRRERRGGAASREA